ncbi:MAG: DUF4212 domain-containing protein [Rhodocyclales bacterium]|nr:DUF4212 domain-containing protein [Rhodocyclales bacterium]
MSKSPQAYWSATLRLISIVLVIWFIVSYVAGIILAPALNSIHLGGYPLGFWFAHQGSMYAFVAMIFYYAFAMDKIDHEFDVHEE